MRFYNKLFLCSFSFLWGPVHHFKSFLKSDRLPFTSAYIGTMFTTVYFAVWVSCFLDLNYATTTIQCLLNFDVFFQVRSTVFTVFFAILQILTLVWYVVLTILLFIKLHNGVISKISYDFRYIMSYIPGGQTGLSFFTRVFYAAVSKTASATLPV